MPSDELGYWISKLEGHGPSVYDYTSGSGQRADSRG